MKCVSKSWIVWIWIVGFRDFTEGYFEGVILGDHPFFQTGGTGILPVEDYLNVGEKLFEQTRRGHWRSLVAEPFECEALRSTNFAGLHSW